MVLLALPSNKHTHPHTSQTQTRLNEAAYQGTLKNTNWPPLYSPPPLGTNTFWSMTLFQLWFTPLFFQFEAVVVAGGVFFSIVAFCYRFCHVIWVLHENMCDDQYALNSAHLRTCISFDNTTSFCCFTLCPLTFRCSDDPIREKIQSHASNEGIHKSHKTTPYT